MSTICLSSRSIRSRISSERCAKRVMSMVALDRRAPDASKRETCDQGRKICRPSVGHDQAGDGRMAVAHGDDEVVDLADRIALGVQHGPADGLAQVEHECHLAVGTSRRRWRDREGRGQPSGGGTDQVHAVGGALAADGTGTVVHGDVWASDAGSVSRRPRGARRSGSVVRAIPDGQRTDPPVRKSCLDPGPMAGPRLHPAMPPSDRARACRRIRRTACLGRAIDGRPRDQFDGRQRGRIDPPTDGRWRQDRP